MAKNDNLTDFLTDVADAIRAKKGTTDKINPQDFSAEIASIETSQEVVEAPFNNVNFRDYDGFILYSYTKDEFLALTEMPPLPTCKGLICQEWNWTWEEAVEYVSEYGILEVGATYITDDGATRLHMRFCKEEQLINVPLYFWQQYSEGVSIDWGDGSTPERVSGTGNVNTSHIYAVGGDYVIKIQCDSGRMNLTHRITGYSIFGNINESNTIDIARTLRKVEFGNKVSALGYQAFADCLNLTDIIIPKGINTIDGFAMLSVPTRWVTIPNGVTQMPRTIGAFPVESVCLPSSFESFIKSCFYNGGIQHIIIPSSTTILSAESFYGCLSLRKLVVPKSITSIQARCFNNCRKMKLYDFTHHEQVPTLENIDAFTGIPTDCEIRVPKALEAEWKQATNWSEYANQIVGV